MTNTLNNEQQQQDRPPPFTMWANNRYGFWLPDGAYIEGTLETILYDESGYIPVALVLSDAGEPILDSEKGLIWVPWHAVSRIKPIKS